ncbi:hypothetical protein DSUL_100043 [Desulfovibrionales bacterium]
MAGSRSYAVKVSSVMCLEQELFDYLCYFLFTIRLEHLRIPGL